VLELLITTTTTTTFMGQVILLSVLAANVELIMYSEFEVHTDFEID
jgi:hypothetical protein